METEDHGQSPRDHGQSPEEEAELEFALPEVSPENIRLGSETSPDAEMPTKDIFVNIILDQDEGVPENRGRYTTWYVLYFIHKKWMENQENREKLSRKIPVFALGNYRTPPFTSEILHEETWRWMRDNWSRYYQVIPITNLYNNRFKTVGVKIPKEYGRHVYQGDTYSRAPYNLDSPKGGRIIYVSIFGKWYDAMSMVETHAYSHREAGNEYQEKWDSVAAYITQYLSCIDTVGGVS